MNEQTQSKTFTVTLVAGADRAIAGSHVRTHEGHLKVYNGGDLPIAIFAAGMWVCVTVGAKEDK